jgi:hypothetical protein
MLILPFALSYSWVEQLSVVGRDGLPQGPPGYPRGNGKLILGSKILCCS